MINFINDLFMPDGYKVSNDGLTYEPIGGQFEIHATLKTGLCGENSIGYRGWFASIEDAENFGFRAISDQIGRQINLKDNFQLVVKQLKEEVKNEGCI